MLWQKLVQSGVYRLITNCARSQIRSV